MLKRVGQTEMEKNHVTPEGAMIRIKDASYRFMETGILYTPEC